MKGHPLIKGAVVTLHRGRRDVRLSVRFLFARWKSVTAALLLVLVAEVVVRTIAPGYVGRVYDQRRTAGHPIEKFSDADELDVASMMGPRVGQVGPTFALRVEGESMRDEGILDGDYIIVERRDTARNGERVVALLPDGSSTMRS